MPDIRKTDDHPGAREGHGDGAAATDAPPHDASWDKPGVTPGGSRTGSSTDGPRTAMDGEGEPDPDRYAEGDGPH